MHSDWSDGHDSMESMASTCHALGYEYIAFTDHSPSSGASRSLSIATVKRQAEQIAAIRERFSGRPSCTAARWTSCLKGGSTFRIEFSSSSISCSLRSTSVPDRNLGNC